MTALRAATAERHRAIERSMPLSRPNPTVADYIDHLRLMRAWLQPLEAWLEDSPRILQTSLIDADLAEAGLQSGQEPAGTRTHCWPVHANSSYRWGARYVMEGSRLGAAVLHRRLSYALRPYKLSYLRGGDGVTGNHWKEFLRELRASVRTACEIEEACEGACDTFDALLAARTPGLSFMPQASEHS